MLPHSCTHYARLRPATTARIRPMVSPFDHSIRTFARRLRGIPRQSVEVALPHCALAEVAIADALLSAQSVVYTAAPAAPTPFDIAIMERFGCRLQILQEPWGSIFQQI